MQTQAHSDWMNEKISPNFKRRELLCFHCYQEGIKDALVWKLQLARDYLSKPYVIIILSGYRCLEHNRSPKVGSNDSSSHPKGYAVDIKCTDNTYRYHLINALFKAGFNRIGIYLENQMPSMQYKRPW